MFDTKIVQNMVKWTIRVVVAHTVHQNMATLWCAALCKDRAQNSFTEVHSNRFLFCGNGPQKNYKFGPKSSFSAYYTAYIADNNWDG